jgi:uncharacterized protein (DUF1501 family)
MIGLDARNDPNEAVHMTGSVVPTMMSGSAPVMAADGLDQISLVGSDKNEWGTRRRSQLDTVWAGGADVRLFDAYRSAARTVDLLAPAAATTYTPDVTYPRAWPASDLSDALKDTARLIKADVGTDVVSIDFGSWDMHSDYGTTEYGNMQNMVGRFTRVVSAFMRDLGPLRSRVTLVTISEFGRRVPENGNRGLDHGWGNMMLLMGGGVRGGYYADWPGLGRDSLEDGDLQVTTDYRNVLGELVSTRFPRRPATSVFPGLAYRPLGVMRA